MDKTTFSSFHIRSEDHFYFPGSSYPWLSSIIYHINCSKHSIETSTWSGLHTNLTRKVCFEEQMNDFKNKTWKSLVLRNSLSKYILKPPTNTSEHTNLWKLEVSFNSESLRNFSKNFSSYGDLVVSSSLTKICIQDEYKRAFYNYYEGIFRSNFQQCATIQTTVNFNTKLLTTRTFEVGHQMLENVEIIYYPDVKIKLLSTETRLMYNWIPYENVKHNDNRFNKIKYKLLNFIKSKFSWRMATSKCQEFGMTLPHLENERKTKEFVAYILNEYALPPYAMFVGLVTKVRILCWPFKNAIFTCIFMK